MSRTKAFASLPGCGLLHWLLPGLLVLGGSSLSAPLTRAGTIFSPAAVINNTMGEASPDFLDDYMVDGSGLFPPFISGVTDFASYLSVNPLHTQNFTGFGWGSSQNVTTGILDFDLGAEHFLTQLAIWPDDFRGPNEVEVLTADNATFVGATSVATINVADPVDSVPVPAQVFALSPSTARYVRLNVLSAHSSSVAIGEVAFDTFVPEPATLASALLGLGVFVTRRRSRK